MCKKGSNQFMKKENYNSFPKQFWLGPATGAVIKLLKKASRNMLQALSIAGLILSTACTTTWPGTASGYQGPYMSFLHLRQNSRTYPDGDKYSWLMVGPNAGFRF
ncbi:MAG: hypothetical protein C5B47_04540 [Verrucomicrobia bacterium]|nr:MAG: hypothetical protein C5B47_04540 [Verrucomicrobiota bacterium]